MNNREMIERYINAVAAKLPQNTRDDVKRELRTNIEDMLPENPSDLDVRNILEGLGNPAKLAGEYRQTKQYLIGPALYDSYVSVLKLVIGIVSIVFAFLFLLGIVTKPNTDVSFGLIGQILGAAFNGALYAFMWVTVVFAFLDRYGLGEGKALFGKEKWRLEDLPDPLISEKSRISRVETVVGIVMTVLCTTIIITQPHLIGWYEGDGSRLILAETFFHIAQLRHYTAAIILLTLFQFIISIYQFITERWTLPLAAVNTVHNVAKCIFVYILFSDRAIINPRFLSRLAEAVGVAAEQMKSGWYTGLTVFIIFFVVVCAIDSISGFVKARKLNFPSIKL